ncbi:MAG TPA: hypothetical protein VHC19_28960, partial [Pirellulales bacterium]|nr:hypothetical protein [Pirellulales bacterium]
MPRLRRILGLALLALAAFGLRLGVVACLAKASPAAVTYEHGEIAENLLAGRGFTVKFLGVEGPTSQQAPFYPALLAGCYWLFGPASTAALLAMQILQCAAGAALALVVVGLAWSLLPERPTLGWVAGYGAALYPAHVYMVTHMQVAIWAALCLTSLVALVASHWRPYSWLKAVLAGLLSGLLLLIDPILAIALPIIAWMFWRSEAQVEGTPRKLPLPLGEGTSAQSPPKGERTTGHSLRVPHSTFRVSPAARCLRLALMASVAALVIAPWLWRNYRVHGEWVFVKSTFGYAFWQGNNAASWGTDKIPKRSAETLRNDHDGSLADMHRALWEARHETLYIDDVLLAPGGYREFTGLTEPERSRLLFSRSWDFVRRHPQRYLRLCARRLRYFLLFDETNPKAANRIYRASTAVWLALAMIGSLALRGRWRRLAPTWAIFGAVALFHSLTIVSARFRIPIEPLSFVWAAGAVAPLVDRLIIVPWTDWRERRQEAFDD